MFRLITLAFLFAYGFRHFFSLMKKSNQKKSRLCRNPTILLSRYGGSEKNSPFYSANGLRPIEYRRAQTLFRFYRLHSCKIGGSVIELVEILQGRSALRVWLRGIFVALGFCTRRNTK
jgi:hypothetical protein